MIDHTIFFRLPPSLSAIVGGLLAGVCFYLPHGWVLASMGVALLLLSLMRARTGFKAFVYGTIFGTLFYGSLFTGVGVSLLPFDWYGIANPFLQAILLSFTVVVASFVLGISIGIFGLLVHLLKTKTSGDLLLFPSIWVLSEVGASYLYYVYMLGPGSLQGPHFTLGYIGYLFASDPAFLQLSWLGGIFILSFAVVFIAVAMAYALLLKQRRYAYLLCAIAIVWAGTSFLLGYVPADEDREERAETILNVAVISRYMEPSLTQGAEQREARFRELLGLIKPLRGLDMVVFPENAAFLRTLRQQGSEEDKDAVVITGRGLEKPVLIDSHDSLQDGVFTSQVTFQNALTMQFGQKQFLLAFGEYIPYFYQFILKVVSGDESLHSAIAARNYIPGVKAPLGLVDRVLVAVRFCDEAMSPFLYRKQVQEGAGVLVNISSLSWFHGSPFVYEHMQRIAKVRAVESGRWFVQSGNMAPAFAVDDRGRVVAETPWNELSILKVKVPERSFNTPYTQGGPFFLLICAAFVLCAIVRLIICARKRSNVYK